MVLGGRTGRGMLGSRRLDTRDSLYLIQLVGFFTKNAKTDDAGQVELGLSVYVLSVEICDLGFCERNQLKEPQKLAQAPFCAS